MISKLMKGLRIFLSITVGLISLLLALWLLIHNYIKGTEFVALVMGVVLISLFIVYGLSVSELTIGRNTIKLREAKSEVESSLLKLKTTTIEMLKLDLYRLVNPVNGVGFRDEGNKIEEIDYFWGLYKVISDLGVLSELADNVLVAADHLKKQQLNALTIVCPKTYGFHYKNIDVLPSNQLPTARELHKHFSDIASEDISATIYSPLTNEEYKEKVLEGIQHYKKLHNVTIAMNKMELKNR
ncbi:Phage abortive infection protein [Vibrio crassostreae]|nr:Phage abortive infection protein [Vibrio crassostreae]CAK3917634.1 Phage abortive infection protein [Vibrio crassostreae]